MSEAEKSFIELALNGEVLWHEIDDFVEHWHKSDIELEIHVYLGMNFEEYSLWVENPKYLALILMARHKQIPIQKAINDNYLGSEKIAARAPNSSEVARLKTWLEEYA